MSPTIESVKAKILIKIDLLLEYGVARSDISNEVQTLVNAYSALVFAQAAPMADDSKTASEVE